MVWLIMIPLSGGIDIVIGQPVHGVSTILLSWSNRSVYTQALSECVN